MAAQERVLGFERLAQHAHRRQVGGAQLPLKAPVSQNRAGLVAEREQDVLVVIAKATLFVGADYHAAKLVLDVDRYSDQVLYLPVGRGAAPLHSPRLVFADDLILLDDLSGEALHDRALPRVIPEALRGDQVEIPVRVFVFPGEQQPLLCAEQPLRQA